MQANRSACAASKDSDLHVYPLSWHEPHIDSNSRRGLLTTPSRNYIASCICHSLPLVRSIPTNEHEAHRLSIIRRRCSRITCTRLSEWEDHSCSAYLVRGSRKAVPVVEGDRDENPAERPHGSHPQDCVPHGMLCVHCEVVWPIKLHCNLQAT